MMSVWRTVWPAFLVLAQMSMAAAVESQAPERLPPFVPDGETIADDTALSENCLATVNDFIAKSNGRLKWELGKPVVSRNVKWGLIWRADFNDGGPDMTPYVNRIVCSKTPGTDKINVQVGIIQTLPLDKYFAPRAAKPA